MPMPGPNIRRICRRCGREYHPTNLKQYYCNQLITVNCEVCGKSYEVICKTTYKQTCSPKCQEELILKKRNKTAQSSTKICKWCGKEFHPKTPTVKYCDDKHYSTCIICGKSFEVFPHLRHAVNKTCSHECEVKLAFSNRDMAAAVEANKAAMLKKYGVTNAFQLESSKEKAKQTCIEKYGAEFYTQTQQYRDSVKETNLQKYGVEHHLSAPEVIAKREQTNLEKYGATNTFAAEPCKLKAKQTFKERYGFENASQVPEIRSKSAKSAKRSKLEVRVADMLHAYNIEFIHPYMLADNVSGLSHEYDFYIPKYKILLDADGLYFHSYISDPNGKQVRDEYDDTRLALIPSDHIFHIIIEQNEDRGMKELVSIIKSIDSGIFDYDSKLFDWCRSIEFPYPSYDDKRLNRDYKSLCNYTRLDNYTPHCRLGESIIRNYHHSIYYAHCGDFLSPYDGWYNDDILKKAILNRLIYINDVDPSKILRGLYISKLAPRVSIFNPVLAKYLINKYLSNYNTIFDPFSGYSGRLLGTCSLGKKYIGQDLNDSAVNEANQIISFLGLDAKVSQKDILESSGKYECLLTCPPYSTKEIYANETVFKSCDAWIDECLNRFDCNKYVFVVDNTEKYKDYIVETLGSTSHLNSVTEYVICVN